MLMPNILIILFAISLLCCGKDQQNKPAEEKPGQSEQAEKKAKNLEAELEAKLRMEYEKRFGTPITDFELSTKSVEYRYLQMSSTDDYPEISITRTATGAIAKYKNDALNLELGIGEWLDFVNALHKCGLKGKNKYYENGEYFDYDGYHNRKGRNLKILSSSSEELQFEFNQEYHYSDWADFLKVIEAMILRIKKEGSAKLEAKLKAEYEKRFGMPMTDFELSIDEVHFQYSPPDKMLRSVTIVATRTAEGGAYMKYSIKDYDEPALNLNLDLEFDIGEWIDIVSTLRRCRIDEWINKYRKIKVYRYWRKTVHDNRYENFDLWNLFVNLLNKDGIYFDDDHWFSFNMGNGYPPNWVSFREAMEGIAEKIREKAEISNK
jgi:hypothetical protein